MTTHAPTPGTETKVQAATASGAVIAAAILTFLSTAEATRLLDGLPDWATVLLGVLVAAAGTWAAGYWAPHSPRP